MVEKLIKIIYLILVIIFAVSFFNVRELPERSEIDESILNEPVQTETTRKDFSFTYRGTDYHVLPIANYKLWGLIVSVNDIGAWYNYYHDENTVNLKDVCVVWGPNIENEVYRDKEVSYKSGEWTCYYSWTGRLTETFYPYKLSNNHLLTADKGIQDIIRGLNVGDQIYLKGVLVDYSQEGEDWYRMTSISRNDENSSSRSGGACEVMYVDEIEVLARNAFFGI